MQPKDIKIHKAIADKFKIVNYANQNSIHMAADKYGVETKSIRNWKKQLPELLKMSDKSIKSTLHERIAETDQVENEIVDWILINKSLGTSVSSWEIIIKECSLNNTLKFKNIKNLQKWCYKIST